MSELDIFCDRINSLPLQGSIIFATSKQENAFRNEVYNSVITIIKNNINCSKTLRCIDFFCGHGIVLDQIKKTYDSELVGIDINNFHNDWNNFENIHFFQKDVFDVIKLKPTFKFDIILTLNTLRAESKMWGQERYDAFLSWCNQHSNYLITNNCINKKLDGFQLVDTVQTPGLYDTNLFKIVKNG